MLWTVGRTNGFHMSQFVPGRLDLIQCTMTWQAIAIAHDDIVVCNKGEVMPGFGEPLGQGMEILVRRLSHIPWTTR